MYMYNVRSSCTMCIVLYTLYKAVRQKKQFVYILVHTCTCTLYVPQHTLYVHVHHDKLSPAEVRGVLVVGGVEIDQQEPQLLPRIR